jgi:hypothetical protein
MKEILSIDHALVYQECNWKLRKKVDMEGKHALPFITISREYGCLGYNVGQAIVNIFNDQNRDDPRWVLYARNVLERLSEDMDISYELAETLTEKAKGSMTDYLRVIFSTYPPEAVVYRKLVEIMRIIAANGHAVIIGRVANVITKDLPKGFHVRIIASPEKKIQNIINQYNISQKEAKKILEQKSEEREKFFLKRLKVDTTDPALYDLVINATNYTINDTAKLIIGGMESAGIIQHHR